MSRGSISFGRYELLRRIGAGGMGEIWLARLPGLSGIAKVCVVKKMLPHLSSDRSFVERFLDEAKVVVHLAHGSIAQVFEMGEADGEYFMAMEYVQGKTLARLIARLRERGERFPLPLALYVGIRVCDALAYAHRRADPAGRPLHVVHRDISPANILVSYDGEVKVIDFGAAQSAIKEVNTAPRVVIGNLAYMSPEQARKKPVDGRADIYSIAVVLWELIAWAPLPSGGNSTERWRRAAYPSFTSPSKSQPDVPAEIDQTIMRALSPDRRDRHQGAEALRDDLQRALSQLASETSSSSLSAFLRQLFSEEAEHDRRMVAEALDGGPASGREAHGAEEDADSEVTTAPAALPGGERPLGDDSLDSRTTKPERARFARAASPVAQPVVAPEPGERTIPDRQAFEAAAALRAEQLVAGEECGRSGETTASLRLRPHGLLRLLLFAVAFFLGTVIAAVAFQLARGPVAPPSASEPPEEAPQGR